MIIDIHVHLIGLSEETGCYVSPRMSRGVIFRVLKYALGLQGDDPKELDEAYRTQLRGWVDASDVDAIGVLAFDAVYDEHGEMDRPRTHVYVSNDYCLQVCRDSPSLLPICSINPNRKDAIEELDRVVALGSVAIKTLPNSQDFDPADPRHLPFFKRMAEHDIPLLTHTSFEHTIPAYNQLWGKPERLVPVLDAGVKVIAAHCASAGVAHLAEDIDTWFDMLDDYPNLYGDISAMGSLSRFPYIHRVLDNPQALRRVLLGSDFPVPVSPLLFAHKIGFNKARQMSKIGNPIQKNYEVFRELGVPAHVMHRATDILKLS